MVRPRRRKGFLRPGRLGKLRVLRRVRRRLRRRLRSHLDRHWLGVGRRHAGAGSLPRQLRGHDAPTAARGVLPLQGSLPLRHRAPLPTDSLPQAISLGAPAAQRREEGQRRTQRRLWNRKRRLWTISQRWRVTADRVVVQGLQKRFVFGTRCVRRRQGQRPRWGIRTVGPGTLLQVRFRPALVQRLSEGERQGKEPVLLRGRSLRLWRLAVCARWIRDVRGDQDRNRALLSDGQ